MTTDNGYIHDDDGNLIPDPDATPPKSSGVVKGRALHEQRHSPKKAKAISPAVAALIKLRPFPRHY